MTWSIPTQPAELRSKHKENGKTNWRRRHKMHGYCDLQEKMPKINAWTARTKRKLRGIKNNKLYTCINYIKNFWNKWTHILRISKLISKYITTFDIIIMCSSALVIFLIRHGDLANYWSNCNCKWFGLVKDFKALCPVRTYSTTNPEVLWNLFT